LLIGTFHGKIHDPSVENRKILLCVSFIFLNMWKVTTRLCNRYFLTVLFGSQNRHILYHLSYKQKVNFALEMSLQFLLICLYVQRIQKRLREWLEFIDYCCVILLNSKWSMEIKFCHNLLHIIVTYMTKHKIIYRK
jgi:hypothetical protein